MTLRDVLFVWLFGTLLFGAAARLHLRQLQAAHHQERRATARRGPLPHRHPRHVEDYEDRRVTFRDAVALQFPVKPQEGAVRPYFLYGQMDKPVNLWRYLADRDGFEETTARGADKIAAQDDDDQDLGVFITLGQRYGDSPASACPRLQT